MIHPAEEDIECEDAACWALEIAAAIQEEVGALVTRSCNQPAMMLNQLHYARYGPSRRRAWTPPLGADTAPWCVLLCPSPMFPGWRPHDLIQLRATCRCFRESIVFYGDSSWFARALGHHGLKPVQLGKPVGFFNREPIYEQPPTWRYLLPLDQTGKLPASAPLDQTGKLAHLLSVVVDEMDFLRALPSSACVAGSHALCRMQRMELNMPPAAIRFVPRDMDIFVGSSADFKEVRALAVAFLAKQFPRGSVSVPAIKRSGYEELGAHEDGPGIHHVAPTFTYSREHTLEILKEAAGYPQRLANIDDPYILPASWVTAIAKLPAEVGIERPYRVVRTNQIRTKPRADELPAWVSPHAVTDDDSPCMKAIELLGHRLPPQLLDACNQAGFAPITYINLIQVDVPCDQPLRPALLLQSFDMVQCQVAMMAELDGTPRFVCSPETRQCALSHEIRLSPFALAPAKKPPSAQGANDCVLRFCRRVRKYERKGFTLAPDKTLSNRAFFLGSALTFNMPVRADVLPHELMIVAQDHDMNDALGNWIDFKLRHGLHI